MDCGLLGVRGEKPRIESCLAMRGVAPRTELFTGVFTMMDIIKINNLQVHAVIGCNSNERINAQELFITVSIAIDTWNAAATDDLRNTLDYDQLARRITTMAERSEFMLVETLAQHVADIVLEDGRVQSVTVSVVKPGALPNAASAEVIITRDNKQS